MTSAPKCGNTNSGQLSEIRQFQELQTLNVSEELLKVVHKVKVHIVTAGETFGADNVLLSHVRSSGGLQLESTDQQGCSIIILFCPISSRVGSDMKAAMKKVSGDKPVILVLMHHTRNPDYSTCEQSQCSVYQNLVLVVQVLFHESVKGLLTSQKNSEAVQQICNKLQQYSRSSISRLRNDQGTQDMSQLSRGTVEEAHEVVHKVKVHIVTAGETFGADNALRIQVRSSRGLQLESTDQQGCSIIILCCPISSRVGSDMKAAMKKVSGDKPVILVLMHHTRNPDYSTCEQSQCSVYQNLVLVVQVLFHESVKGLLTSQKNSEAVQQICNKLRQYSRSSISRLRNDQGTQDMSQLSRGTVEEAHEVVHKVKVHIVTAGETFGADNALRIQVRSSRGLQLESTDQQGCSIIILCCPISSRVGSDMKAAMKKVSGDKPVILVLMHHTRNPDYSTCEQSQCSVYQNLVLVVQVLFHESVKGLLTSQKNSEAVQQICNKLRQYSRSSISRLRNDQGTQDMSQLSRGTVEEAHEVVHKVKVHIVTAGETFGADNALRIQVRSSRGLQLESTDQQGCSIIILCCPISSRVGSDMKAAMKKVSGDKPVILVLMHHTRNPDYSTCEQSQCSVYQNLVLVVQVLFHESVKGLLTSQKNSEAVQQICNKLRQYSRSSISRLRNDQGTQDMSQLSRGTVEEAHEGMVNIRDNKKKGILSFFGFRTTD